MSGASKKSNSTVHEDDERSSQCSAYQKLEWEVQQLELQTLQKKAELARRRSSRSEAQVSVVRGEDKPASVRKWLRELQRAEDYGGGSPRDVLPPPLKSNDIKMCVSRQAMERRLPQFNGDPKEWILFITQYYESTEICQFSDAENLVRLRQCLGGEARELVKMLLISHTNVPKIIETLSNMYGKAKFVIKACIQEVRELQRPRIDSPTTIIKYTSAVINLVTVIQHLQKPQYLYDPQLIEEIIDKLPGYWKLQWAERSLVIEDPNLEDVMIWLEKVNKVAIEMYSSETSGAGGSKRGSRQQVLLVNKEKDVASMTLSERWEMVKAKKLCIACLKPGHQISGCKVKARCGVNDCKRWHNKLLHGGDVQTRTAESVMNTNRCGKKVLLRVVPVILAANGAEVEINALLDEGSTVTLIDDGLAKKLGLRGEREPLCLRWTNGETQEEELSESVRCQIKGKYENPVSYDIVMKTVRRLQLPSQGCEVDRIQERWPYMKTIPVGVDGTAPLVLIGSDNFDLIMPREYAEGATDAPKAVKSKLGWSVVGPMNNFLKPADGTADYMFHVQDLVGNKDDYDYLNDLIKKSFEIDALGIKAAPRSRSRLDEYATKIMEETTRRVGDRFETGLLWRDPNTVCPESKQNALFRLKCQERKMDKDPEFARMYCAKITEYCEKGYMKKLSTEEAQLETCKTWYLPHFAVFNARKGKLRFVFDAAAKSNGRSLNDMLLSGPDLMTPLLDVLWPFRNFAIAFTADIREMFHQVKIRQEDRPAHRLLWRGENRQREPEVYEMQVMIFGAVCSPSKAQYVKNRNAEELREKYPKAYIPITKHHYVDDYLDSCATEEEASQRILEVMRAHQEGGFVICEWLSNSEEVMHKIPEALRAKKHQIVNLNENTLPERVLGMWWNPATDLLEFKWSPDVGGDKNARLTKRLILRTVMSMFDPIGIFGNHTIRAKILLQDIWRKALGWDDEITAEMRSRWQEWVVEMEKAVTLKVPRCYSPKIPVASRLELHTFCDASELAYCAVTYLRVVGQFSTEVAFVSAKCRVAPIKFVSIPRLELQAALIGSRLSNSIKEAISLKIDKNYLWSDSRTVLCWIRNDSQRLKTFVANRVGEIQENTSVEDWRWVPTAENVADGGTRKQSETATSWLEGPQFLRNPEELWPSEAKNEAIGSDIGKEEYVMLVEKRSDSLYEALPDIVRFSSWTRLIRSTAYVLKFVHRRRDFLPLLRAAELMWCRAVQEDVFRKEVQQLKSGKSIDPASRLYRLTPILSDDGLLTLGGRTNYSDVLQDDTKNPIILDNKHRLTRLILRHYHQLNNHINNECTLNEVRQKFWIIQARQTLKSVCRECNLCKIRKCKPNVVQMGQLPPFRLTVPERAFTYTGVDYFGPYDVAIGRRREKRYGAIFTCMSCRAIHLELAESLSTDAMILVLRRFIARRGAPKLIISDNGTNFRGASNELREMVNKVDHKLIEQELVNKYIKWEFIPPASPHMGGAWERMVQAVKRTLSCVLKEACPRLETLQTIFAETEHMVNCRPLTYVPDDPDQPECVTPNHFLIGSSSGCRSLGIFDGMPGINVKKQWIQVQMMLERIWKRWVKEYLPTLTRRSKWFAEKQSLKEGEVVVVMDNSLPRNNWPLGRIVKACAGRDGRVRVVEVQTGKGIYKRPVTKVCRIDLLEQEG